MTHTAKESNLSHSDREKRHNSKRGGRLRSGRQRRAVTFNGFYKKELHSWAVWGVALRCPQRAHLRRVMRVKLRKVCAEIESFDLTVLCAESECCRERKMYVVIWKPLEDLHQCQLHEASREIRSKWRRNETTQKKTKRCNWAHFTRAMWRAVIWIRKKSDYNEFFGYKWVKDI